MTANEANWTLDFRFDANEAVLHLALNHELLIGRSEGPDSTFIGCDLSHLKGEDLGVSRRHALLRDEGDHVSLTDLNSSNGTFINGRRLPSGQAETLKDNDRVQFGNLLARVTITDSLGQSTIRDAKVKLNLRAAPKIGRGQRVLIVEDDPRTTDLYQLMLKRAGYTVQISRDVVGAIRIINQSPPSVILLDLLLPSLNGLELCRYIRRDTQTPDLPIIIMSALSDSSSVQQAMDAGADIYLSKPPNYKELARVIGAFIQKQEAERRQGIGTRKLGTGPLNTPLPQSVKPPTKNTIIAFVEGEREPVSLVVSPHITLGRGNGTAEQVIDLDPYGAYDKGVSRTHAEINLQEDGTFMVEDLGSSNGTFINGRKLEKNTPIQLKYGDELRLGELRMIIYMLTQLKGTGSLPGTGSLAGTSQLPGTGSLAGTSQLPGTGQLPPLPSTGVLPGTGALPGTGKLPGTGPLPGTGQLPANGAKPETGPLPNSGSSTGSRRGQG
jgi:pSer/pThr/pTyr-binding forkhead associated (FHA) protein